jgi:small basic protein (TIGR04137 family)
MSIHPSLRGVSTLVGERSVLTRQERIQSLQKTGKFKEGERSVFGLPKVRTRFKVAGVKKAPKPEAAAAPGATAAGGAAPAAGAKPGAAPAAAAKPAAPAKGGKK